MTDRNPMLTEIPTKLFRGEGFMTVIVYNNKGNLMYVGDKNSKIIYSIDVKTNKIQGAFYGHNGTVWHLAVSPDDNILVSCGADMTVCFFNTLTGELIHKANNYQDNSLNISGIPKQVTIWENKVLIFYDGLNKRHKPYFVLYDLTTLSNSGINIINKIECDNTDKPSILKWFDSNKVIIGYESGKIVFRDMNQYMKNTENMENILIPDIIYDNFHTSTIKSLEFNNAKTLLLTGSTDTTAKLIKINSNYLLDLEPIYTCESTCPVNYAIFSYNEKKIILGGGADAIGVAMSGSNDFTIKLFGIKEKKLISKLSTHFGPVRYLARAPGSKNFASASQDGLVKIYILDSEFDETSKISKMSKLSKSDQTNNYIEPEPFGIDDLDTRLLSDETNKYDYVNVKTPSLNSNSNANPSPKINYVPGMSKPPGYIDDSVFVLDNKYLNEIQDAKVFENDVNKTTIKISGLPIHVEHNDIKDLFEFHGKILEHGGVKICYRDNYRDKCTETYAFVKYVYEESAQKAIEARNNKPFMHMIIRVELAESR